MLCLVASILALTMAQSNDLLYGMSEDMNLGVRAENLETIDTKTAQPVQVWPSLPYEAQGQGLSSIDVTNGIFYIIGTNFTTDVIALVGMSVVNGSVLFEIPLPFLLEVFVGIGQYCDVDATSGNVYVTGRDPTSLSHRVYRVNPFTNEIHFVANVGDGQGLLELLGGISVLDPVNRVLWIQLARNDSGNILIRYYGYDIDTGFLLNVLDDQLGMSTFDFYSSTGLIYGIGYQPKGDSYVHTLVSFNSLTTVFTEIKVITGFTDLLSAVSAIDETNGILWVYLTAKKGSAHRGGLWAAEQKRYVQEKTTTTQSPIPSMNLVGIDISTGEVISSVLACQQFPDCPWNIQYLS